MVREGVHHWAWSADFSGVNIVRRLAFHRRFSQSSGPGAIHSCGSMVPYCGLAYVVAAMEALRNCSFMIEIAETSSAVVIGWE
jgi:hypothetical protein